MCYWEWQSLALYNRLGITRAAYPCNKTEADFKNGLSINRDIILRSFLDTSACMSELCLSIFYGCLKSCFRQRELSFKIIL